MAKPGEQIKLLKIAPTDEGQIITVDILGMRQEIMLPLAGEFQVMNALCALGLVIGAGGDATAASRALAKVTNVPGRLELVARLANNAAEAAASGSQSEPVQRLQALRGPGRRTLPARGPYP